MHSQDYYSKENIEQGYDFTNDKDKYPNGKLSVVEINNQNCSSILAFNNTPIMNSFVDRTDDTFYFIPVKNGKEVEFNPSFLFTKANQIILFDKGNDKFKLSQYYNRYSNISEKYHLVCSEVFTNTGIKCRSTMFTPFGGSNMSVKDIEKSITEISSNELIKLTQTIYESVKSGEEIDLKRYFNLLLGKKDLKK